MTKTIIMGLDVEPWIMDRSQCNRGTRSQHLPYRCVHRCLNGPLTYARVN